MTPILTFRMPIRVILGDRQVHGFWMYSDDTVDSAVKTAFAIGKGPDGYSLDSTDLTVAANIAPDVAFGDPFALVCCEAALMMIAGEDGGMQIKTRAMWVRDEGHRKRDLLWRLEQECYRIRNGEVVFLTFQSFAAFLGVVQKDNETFPIEEFTGITVDSTLGNIVL